MMDDRNRMAITKRNRHDANVRFFLLPCDVKGVLVRTWYYCRHVHQVLYFSWNVIVRHGRNPTRKKTTFLTMIIPFCLFLSTHSSKNREIDTIMSRKVIEFDRCKEVELSFINTSVSRGTYRLFSSRSSHQCPFYL